MADTSSCYAGPCKSAVRIPDVDVNIRSCEENGGIEDGGRGRGRGGGTGGIFVKASYVMLEITN